jgi:peroxiredoxin
MRLWATRALFLALATISLSSAALAGPSTSTPATKVVDFSLKDSSGRTIALGDFSSKRALVVVFIGVECPISNDFLLPLSELYKKYSTGGVQFLAINSNQQDSAARVAEHARKNGIPFPVLKDERSAVAQKFGARRTPEAFVLDSDGTIRYRGRISDQFGIGFKRSQPTRADLAAAIDEVLAGKPVAIPQTEVAGCFISRPAQTKGDGRVTYTKEISRIIQKNCEECHRPGQIGPMSLQTYTSVTAWSDTIREVLQEKRMPPWRADPRYGKFANDRSLSQKDRETFLEWLDDSCPKGDIKDAPARLQYADAWVIGKPDVIISMDQSYEVPAEAPKEGIPYQYFEVDPNFQEDRWVQFAEARPGAPSVVHHIVVFTVPPGLVFHPKQPDAPILCGEAPGDMPLILPEGSAKKIPAHSKLIFQMHYTPNGIAAKDRSQMALIFAKSPPKQIVYSLAVANMKFDIPPGDNNYKVESEFRFFQEAEILNFMPHMHLRGKDFLYEAIYPHGKRETLLWVPNYNFNWQSVYRLEKPLKMPKGAKLHCTAHFDNSTSNPNNPDASKEIRWGDQTWEEMMIGWADVAFRIKD